MVKFLLLCSPRTGSSYLSSALNGHSEIRAYGELFNLDQLGVDEAIDVFLDPVAYLHRSIKVPDSTKAYGFKLFYSHFTEYYFHDENKWELGSERLHEDMARLHKTISHNISLDQMFRSFRVLWQFLRENNDYHIIHLLRRNKLKTLVSLKTAYKNDRWAHWMGRDPAPTSVSLNKNECIRFFTDMENFESNTQRNFQFHPMLEVYYEDFFSNQRVVSEMILDFLKVPHEPIFSPHKKQITSSLKDVISNYVELKSDMAKTPWNHYFSPEE